MFLFIADSLKKKVMRIHRAASQCIVATCLRSPDGGIPASTGSSSTGVGCRHPVMICRVLFRLTSTSRVCLLLLQTSSDDT